MIQFELKDVYGVGTPSNAENNSMTMSVNIKVGVVGMPYDDAHARFFPEFTEVYTWSKDLTSTQAEEDMITFASQWVSTNFPPVE
jgi:hypothetical protein